MEDYHVIRVLRNSFCQGIADSTDYPILLGWRIDRIQCDPKEIEDELKNKIVEYIKCSEPGPQNKPTALLTAEDYADLIVWGLRGLITSIKPACADWNFVMHYWPEEHWKKILLKHLWSFTYTQDAVNFEIPNPFYIEIATDFLKELIKMKPGIAGVSANHAPEIQKLAKKVIESWNAETAGNHEMERKNGSSRNEGILEIKEFSFAGPRVPQTRLNAIDLMNYIAQNCNFGTNQEKGGKRLLKTWLRPDKWGTPDRPIKAPTTQDLGNFPDPPFDGACVDRAFYKSCNMMALQTMAGNLWGAIEPIDT
jgi:hypothetical protein